MYCHSSEVANYENTFESFFNFDAKCSINLYKYNGLTMQLKDHHA
jgi:hypothetical protein